MTREYAIGWNHTATVIHEKPPMFQMTLERFYDEAQRSLLRYDENRQRAEGVVACIKAYDATGREPAIIRRL